MGIQSHPVIPFIEVGTSLDYAQRHGYADDADFHGTENEWVFKIAGCNGMMMFQSAADALLAAEETLFSEETELVTEKVSNALASGDTSLALALVERRGYWAGKADMTRHMKELLTPAFAQLNLAAAKRG